MQFLKLKKKKTMKILASRALWGHTWHQMSRNGGRSNRNIIFYGEETQFRHRVTSKPESQYNINDSILMQCQVFSSFCLFVLFYRSLEIHWSIWPTIKNKQCNCLRRSFWQWWMNTCRKQTHTSEHRWAARWMFLYCWW